MKNLYVYNFTANSGLMVKDFEYGIDPGIEDKIVNYFDDTYWLDHKKYSIEEKNHLAWFIYEDITCRIALHFNLV